MRKPMLICALFAFVVPMGMAQSSQVTAKPLTDSDIQLMRSDIRADKQDIITHTMQFTDTESKAFWPVYREYANDQDKIGDDRLQLIQDYAKNYDSMDDAKADNMGQRMLNIDARYANLRQTYWPQFEKAIGAKRAAKFYQVDSRLTLMINLQLASAIPLIP